MSSFCVFRRWISFSNASRRFLDVFFVTVCVIEFMSSMVNTSFIPSVAMIHGVSAGKEKKTRI